MEDVAIIGLVVEGHGEEQALPTLIRKLAQAHGARAAIKCSVRRVPKSQFVRPGELERAVEALTRQIGRTRPILVLLDADNDCAKSLSSDLRTQCDVMHSDVAIGIVLAQREYEAWFLAAARSLSGRGGLALQLEPPSNPELVQGAKEWLSAHMPSGESYSPTRHQSAFSSLLDLEEARTARSFRKLEKELVRLLKWRSD